MARKYARDNQGRFASKGTGATARGGRLRTEAGNKRETQTMQVKGGGSKLRNRNQATLQKAASKGDKSAMAALNAQRKGLLRPARKDTKNQGWGTGLDQGGAPKRIALAKPKPPKPTKEDRSIESVKNLKVASQIGGRAKLTFIPDSALTPKRRRALGISSFSTSFESQRYRVSRQSFGGQSGVSISERSGYQSSLPKPKAGVIKRRNRK